MNNFNKHDGNCALSAADLFMDQLVQDDIIGSTTEAINPINSLQGTRVIEFLVKGNDDFIDLHQTELQLKVRIKNTDNSNLAAAAAVATINYPLATLFEHVDVYLNNDLVSNTSNYGYKAYMETLLTYSTNATETWLQASGYYKDKHDKLNVLADDNTGFKARRDLLETSKTVELIGKIHSELFTQDRLLLNHVDLKLVFTRHNDDFCLMSAADGAYKIEIVDAWLNIRRNTLSSHKANQMESLLQKQDARYFVPRVQVKAYTFARGLRNIHVRNSATGRDIPNRIAVGLVSNAAYNGNKAQNPFNFQHFNMTSADILVDSKSVFGKALSSNFANGQYLQPFMSMHSAMGFIYKDDGCSINRDEYPDGFTFVCADLSHTKCDGQYEDPVRSGNLDIEFTFSAALAATTTVIIFMQYNNTISINSSRRAVTNFA
jgi:hypothetical protein